MTILEENIGTNLYYLDLGNDVLDMKPKAEATWKTKLDFIKI